MRAASPAPARWLIVTVTVGLGAALGVRPASIAQAARLAGGAQQAAIRRAFDAAPAARGQSIVSIRVSTTDPAWAVVKSIRAAAVGQTATATAAATTTTATATTTSSTSSGGAPLPLRSTYLRRAGPGEVLAAPPAAVRADLTRPFRVAVVYSGSGMDAIDYTQSYTSACAGSGPFTDSETLTVAPMSWTIRWIVDLDHLLGDEAGPEGTAIAPAIAFSPAGSRVRAVEQVQRQLLDAGCNGRLTTTRCRQSFRAGGAGAASALTVGADGGLQLAVPTAVTSSGSCDPADYVLGPSLWDLGATTAVVPRLGLLGGSLPADPYAPVSVAWPASASPAAAGLVTSPCTGDEAACSDAFAWRGTVQITPAG